MPITSNPRPRLPACAAAIAIAVASTGTEGASIQPTYAAVHACQPALPAYEGAIRKRPKAVQNEGTVPAFVTCGVSGDYGSNLDKGIYYVRVAMINMTPEPVAITCTLVPGMHATTSATHLPVTSVMPVGDIGWGINWIHTDHGGRFGTSAAVSCALPPGIGISGTMSYYTE